MAVTYLPEPVCSHFLHPLLDAVTVVWLFQEQVRHKSLWLKAITNYADYKTCPSTNWVHAEADYLASENKETDKAEKLVHNYLPRLLDNSVNKRDWTVTSVKTKSILQCAFEPIFSLFPSDNHFKISAIDSFFSNRLILQLKFPSNQLQFYSKSLTPMGQNIKKLNTNQHLTSHFLQFVNISGIYTSKDRQEHKTNLFF